MSDPVLEAVSGPAFQSVRERLDSLGAAPPQVLLLEGGSEAARTDAALYWAYRCSCPSARELAVTRFQQARAFAAAKVNQIRKAATEQASTICDYAQEKGEVIRDKAKKFHEAGEEYVKEKPTQSVLIAMGVGLLIGLLIRRR